MKAGSKETKKQWKTFVFQKRKFEEERVFCEKIEKANGRGSNWQACFRLLTQRTNEWRDGWTWLACNAFYLFHVEFSNSSAVNLQFSFCKFHGICNILFWADKASLKALQVRIFWGGWTALIIEGRRRIFSENFRKFNITIVRSRTYLLFQCFCMFVYMQIKAHSGPVMFHSFVPSLQPRNLYGLYLEKWFIMSLEPNSFPTSRLAKNTATLTLQGHWFSSCPRLPIFCPPTYIFIGENFLRQHSRSQISHLTF